MFLGFFKEGISLMFAFFALIALSNWLDFYGITFLLPVIWFYAFFDSLNKNSLTDEEFEQLEDHYLFVKGIDGFKGLSFSKYRTIAAVIIILLGLDLLCNNIVSILATLGLTFSYEIHQILFRYIPQIVIAMLIITVGLYLIAGKKQTLERDFAVEEKPFPGENPDQNQGGDF